MAEAANEVPASLLERHVCHVKKSLQQELAEIDMGNFLNPPKLQEKRLVFLTAKKITVHLVSHSHMDVGWLKTVDQCYFGANNTIQQASCQFILESVVAALSMDSKRKFTYAEQAFFQRWYEEQGDIMKERVKKLVHDKQLVFVDGGWAQHDEGLLAFCDD